MAFRLVNDTLKTLSLSTPSAATLTGFLESRAHTEAVITKLSLEPTNNNEWFTCIAFDGTSQAGYAHAAARDCPPSCRQAAATYSVLLLLGQRCHQANELGARNTLDLVQHAAILHVAGA